MQAASKAPAPSGRAALTHNLRFIGHRVAAGGIGGFGCGLIIGGIGGRMAMFVLRLTTGDHVAGLESDDGFIIGSFTSDTLFLVGMAAFMGGLVGIVYAGLRDWVPVRARAAASAGFLGMVGGAAIVHPEGVDFTLLGPRWLAILLFVLLPAGFGYAMSATVERLLKRRPGRVLPWIGVLVSFFPLLVMGARGGLQILIVLAVVTVLLAALMAGSRFDLLRRLPKLPAVVWTVRAALAAGATAGAWLLARDVVAIL